MRLAGGTPRPFELAPLVISPIVITAVSALLVALAAGADGNVSLLPAVSIAALVAGWAAAWSP